MENISFDLHELSTNLNKDPFDLMTHDSHVMPLYCCGMVQEVPTSLRHIYNLQLWDVPTLCDPA